MKWQSSEEGQRAIAYLEEMGGVERDPFPEGWAYVHDGPGGEGTPVSIARRVTDAGVVAVAFFEVSQRERFPAEPGEGDAGVAVLHDGLNPPRAFLFDDPAAFDDAVTDSDIRGIFGS